MFDIIIFMRTVNCKCLWKYLHTIEHVIAGKKKVTIDFILGNNSYIDNNFSYHLRLLLAIASNLNIWNIVTRENINLLSIENFYECIILCALYETF